MSSSTEDRQSARWVDTTAAILLALAAVATAWSSYQASRWTGEQAQTFSAANAARVESTKEAQLANSQQQVDIELFMQWVDARLTGDDTLEQFYQARFRDEFRPAFRAWLGTDPFNDQSAPSSPFVMSDYVLASKQEAEALEAKANATSELAKVYVQRATNYVLGVVLFAVALFFAGISIRMPRPGLRMGVLAVGIAVFLLAAAWIATFPISLSI